MCKNRKDGNKRKAGKGRDMSNTQQLFIFHGIYVVIKRKIPALSNG